MDEKLTMALSFGQFSDLDQEEYGKILNLFSKPVPKSRAQFPWDEVEYFSQGEGASIRRSDESDGENDGENSPDTSHLQSKVTTQTKAAYVPKHKPAVEFVIRNKSKMCNEGAMAAASSSISFNHATKPRRNKKKKRDPNYYEIYSSEQVAAGHPPHNHVNSDESNMGAVDSHLVHTAAIPTTTTTIAAATVVQAKTAHSTPPSEATAVSSPPTTLPAAATDTTTHAATTTPTPITTAAVAAGDDRTIGDNKSPILVDSESQPQVAVGSASTEQSSSVCDSTSQSTPTAGTESSAVQPSSQAAAPAVTDSKIDQSKAVSPKASWAGLFHNTETAKSSQVIFVVPPKPQPMAAENSIGSPTNANNTGNTAASSITSTTTTTTTSTTATTTTTNAATTTTTNATNNTACFEEDFKIEQVSVDKDQYAKRLGSAIIGLELNHRPVALHSRGLINTSNWCYINSILQVLVACPPFYNYLRSLPKFSSYPNRSPTSMPMLDRLIRFVNEFDIMHSNKQQLVPGKRPELTPGPPFEPSYIYQLVSVGKTCLSSKGRQEDAEEFLGCLLNGLHEEMLVCMTAASTESEVDGAADPEAEVRTDPDDPDQEDGWQEVQKGKKNKSSITRGSNFEKSPISEIFGGQIRSVLQQPGSKESATLQPFFTLQLDIQSEKIWSVKDALQYLNAKETLHDYTKGEGEVEACRRIYLERLPFVLILHLKRFIYDKSGGCQKLIKKIECNIDIDISKDLLSANMKSKVNQGQRSYKLFAILYHHGSKASGGHYTTDMFHVGINGWVRLDDQHVKVVRQSEVLKGSTDSQVGPGSKGQNPVPYLLCYRRCDLLNIGSPLTRILGQQLQQQNQYNNFRPAASPRQTAAAAADP